MDTIEKNKLDMLRKVCDSVPEPFIIFDNSRSIYYYNQNAQRLFNISDPSVSLYEIFSPIAQQRLDKFIEESSRLQKNIKEIVTLELGDGTLLKGSISIAELISDSTSRYYSFSFSQQYYWASDNLSTRVTIRQDEFDKFISNTKIIQIIDEIKSSYPFTFLGKNKVQQEINKLEDYFWIKDANDVIVLANRKFASTYGLKTTQIEGKPERIFIPSYYVDFYRSIESYIKDSLNALIIEGVPFRGVSSWQNFETIEIPLADAENNILAIIGISQKKKRTVDSDAIKDYDLIEKINIPLAIFDIDGTIIQASKKLKEINTSIVWSDTNVLEVFGEKHIEGIRKFIESPEQVNLTLPEFSFMNNESSLFLCVLDKSISKSANKNTIIATFFTRTGVINFEDFLRYKGSMFDMLIRYNPDPIFIYDNENLRFLEVNDVALALYGYKRDEFLQLDLTDLYTQEDIQSLLDSTPSRDSVPEYKGPFKHRKKDGSSIAVKLAKTSFDYDGHDAHFNLIKNVSALEKSSADTSLFNAIYENTSDIVVETDSVGFIERVNNAALKFFGKSAEELKGSSLLEFTDDGDRGLLNTKIFFASNENSVNLQVRFKSSNAESINTEVSATVIDSPNKNGESYFLIIKPELKPLEIIKEVPVEVYKEVIKEIIKEVPIQNDGPVIGHSNDISVSTGLDLNQISMMFHEILTPINVILGFLQEIKDGLEHPTSDQKEALDYISQNRDNLLNIMNAVSEYAQFKVKSNELLPSELEFPVLYESLLKDEDEIFDHLMKKPVSGKISSSLIFYSDEQKFKQFLALFTKIALNITEENQVYISGSQVDELTFAVTLRDDFAKISQRLMTNFDELLHSKSSQSPRTFNLSRYQFMGLSVLVELLKGKFNISNRNGQPFEIGFIFPMNLFEERRDDVIKEDFTFVEPAQNTIEKEPKFEPFLNNEKFTDFKHEDEPAEEPRQQKSYDDYDFEIPSNTNFSFQSSPAKKEPSRNKYESIADEFSFDSVLQENTDKIVVERSAPKQAGAPALRVEQIRNSPVVTPVEQQKKSLDLSSMKALYIEDQVDSQILFKVQMKELQELKFAVSFEEALPLLTSYTFDFIVMDINLQGEYNGLDALKMVHQMPGFQLLPIIAVTAYVLPGDKDKFIAAGFNDFISKPIFREKLIESLEKIFLK